MTRRLPLFALTLAAALPAAAVAGPPDRSTVT